ncbi:non-ribosomal peptide synthetase [Pseudoalteromonas sp. NBT06-2]|uniref:non-ribosomal peptide synthetase n=1 Tax=Pseudoalteromonas sp. NBT06-2 TaxID=2025950 RepID=UPI001482E7BB|nr:non-ribosomal peptide synthetase [Pseudoalteromonas sp. NBT06-2]
MNHDKHTLINEIYQPSAAQLDIYFFDQKYAGTPVSNIGGYLKLEGEFDHQRLQQAYSLIVRKSDICQMQLSEHEHSPVFTLNNNVNDELELLDFSIVACPTVSAKEWVDTEFAKDISMGGCLHQASVIKINSTEHWYFMKVHHIIIDGWGFTLWCKHLLHAYHMLSKVKISELEAIQLPSFVDTLKVFPYTCSDPKRQSCIEYWKEEFKTLPESVFQIEYQQKDTTNGIIHSRRMDLEIEAKPYQELMGKLEAQNIGMLSYFLSCLCLYFAKVSSNDDIVIGLPAHNRKTKELKGIIGLFMSVAPNRFEINKDLTFAELVKYVTLKSKQNYRNKNLSLGEINREVGMLENGLEQLFQIIFNYQKLDFKLDFEGQSVATEYSNHGYEQTPLTLSLCEYDKKLPVTLYIDYNVAYFDDEDIRLLMARIEPLILTAIDNKDVLLKDFNIFAKHEAEQLESFNHHNDGYEGSVPQWVMSAAQQYGNKDALFMEKQKLTYSQLDAKVNQMTRELLEMGVKKREFVILMMDRTLDMIVSLLAIQRVGAAFIPVDPEFPKERVAFIIEDSQANFCISQKSFKSFFSSVCTVLYIDDETVSNKIRSHSCEPIPAEFISYSEDDPAYLIYTSGSTGLPKGVVIEQGSFANFLFATKSKMKLVHNDRWLSLTTISFDISLFEIFAPLSSGGQLVIAAKEQVQDGKLLANLLEEQNINVMQATPSSWNILLSTGWRGRTNMVALSGGEPLKASLVEQLLPKCKTLWNCYGPTEATIWSMVRKITKDTPVPEQLLLGGALANVEHYVLDKNMSQQPLGATGELYIGGHALAKEYWRRPELTCIKFHSDILINGVEKRLYATGDLVRMKSNNLVEFLGRIDNQVKVRGYRIELGEIENQIEQFQEINETAVTTKESSSGESILVAYLVFQGDSELPTAELKAKLSTTLPQYMIPQLFVILDELPRTANGKLDKASLPEPIPTSDTERVELIGDVELWLQSTWAEELGVTDIGGTDSFFAVGGNSLSANRIINAIEHQYCVRLPLKTIFEYPSIYAIAGKIRELQITSTSVSEEQILPLNNLKTDLRSTSYAQQRMWLLDRLDSQVGNYNMPLGLRLSGKVDLVALEHAFHNVIDRHEILRTAYLEENNNVYQVRGSHKFVFNVEDLTSINATQEDICNVRVQEELHYCFDLSAGEVLRASLLLLAEDESVLLVTLHHIASDGLSNVILLKEISSSYNAKVNNEVLALPKLTIDYSDYAHWQSKNSDIQKTQEQLEFWRKTLKDVPMLHNLPTNRVRSLDASFEGAVLRHELTTKQVDKVYNLAQQQEVTPYILLHCIFTVLLYRLSGEQDIVVGTPVANRGNAALGNLVGLFANTLVLRSDLAGTPDFLTLLQKSKTSTLEAFEYEDTPFELLVKELQPQRNVNHTPLFQVMFSYQEEFENSFELDGINAEPIHSKEQTSKFDLTLVLEENTTGIKAEWEYATAIFDESMISMFSQSFINLLDAICLDPAQEIDFYPMLSKAQELHIAGVSRSERTTATSHTELLHSYVEQQAQKTPDAIALYLNDERCTYRELNERANQLAHYLISSGVKQHSVVGVLLPSSVELVITMMAVLKAGCGFLPLDEQNPKERILHIIEDAQASTILVNSHTIDILAVTNTMSIDTPSTRALVAEQSTDNIAPATIGLTQKDTAYIIYTSGSTGKPKGVVIPHESIAIHIKEMAKYLVVSEQDVALQFASWTVDTALEQLFCALFSGASVLLRSSEIWDAEKLLYLITKYKVSLIDLPPAYFKSVIQQMHELDLGWQNNSLRAIVFGGEALSKDVIAYWQQYLPSQVSLFNAYGPTEATITASVHCFERNGDLTQPVKIGKPVAGKRIFILNPALNILPFGVYGELYIGGHGLATGYLNKEMLTHSVFIEHPQYGRLYKTGDLGRYTAQGEIELQGRSDSQVKIRGHRIELEEIGSELNLLSHIDSSVVVPRKGVNDETFLVGFVMSQRTLDKIEIDALKQQLKLKLPAHFIPKLIIQIDEFPFTSNNKIDRNVLMMRDVEITQEKFQEPETDTQRKLADIWCDLLELDQISINADFFEQGGHSLLASRMLSHIRQNFDGIEVALKQVFITSQLSNLASHLDLLLLQKDVLQITSKGSNNKMESFEL